MFSRSLKVGSSTEYFGGRDCLRVDTIVGVGCRCRETAGLIASGGPHEAQASQQRPRKTTLFPTCGHTSPSAPITSAVA
jgi:hypothetical protein